MIEREDHGARPPAYGTAMYLTGQSRGNTAQCEYIGSSMEQSWFDEVILRSGLRGMISVQLVVGPGTGYARRILNSPIIVFQ